MSGKYLIRPAPLLLIAGALIFLAPLLLVLIWPTAQSENLPDDLSRYPNSYYAPLAERIDSWSDARLARTTDEDDLAYAGRLMEIVHNATYHCEAHNYKQSWFTWVAYKSGIYSLMPYNNHGVLDVRTFRCGFCHQRAYILARALNNGGINSARVLGLGGHVITVIELGNELIALDPDFGVGPVKITGIDKTGISIAPDTGDQLWQAYYPITKFWSEEFTQKIIDIYLSRENNEYYNMTSLNRLRFYQGILFSFEKLIEYYLYALGALLLMLGIYMQKKKIQSFADLQNSLNANFSG